VDVMEGESLGQLTPHKGKCLGVKISNKQQTNIVLYFRFVGNVGRLQYYFIIFCVVVHSFLETN
jgi:hypothetical protein